ncbi:MAG: hypothetical protein DHS20C18_38600 [Saprospiraceae bacterium]|nr:MAG: hypothetical protein DHS20C18_38600 [Saprospiraceae bacterium]
MKKLTLLSLFIVMILTIQHATAQNRKTLYKGFEGSIGVGLLPTFVKDRTKTEVPPISLTLGYRINEKFSLGLFAGFTQAETNPDLLNEGNGVRCQNKFSSVGLRLAVHSIAFKKWDFYGGMTLGYTRSKLDVLEGDVEKLKQHKRYKPVTTKPLVSAFLGGKYEMSPKLGVFGELGYGISLFTVGMTYKFIKVPNRGLNQKIARRQ